MAESGSWRLALWYSLMEAYVALMSLTVFARRTRRVYTRPWNNRPSVWLRWILFACITGNCILNNVKISVFWFNAALVKTPTFLIQIFCKIHSTWRSFYIYKHWHRRNYKNSQLQEYRYPESQTKLLVSYRLVWFASSTLAALSWQLPTLREIMTRIRWSGIHNKQFLKVPLKNQPRQKLIFKCVLCTITS